MINASYDVGGSNYIYICTHFISKTLELWERDIIDIKMHFEKRVYAVPQQTVLRLCIMLFVLKKKKKIRQTKTTYNKVLVKNFTRSLRFDSSVDYCCRSK